MPLFQVRRPDKFCLNLKYNAFVNLNVTADGKLVDEIFVEGPVFVVAVRCFLR